MSYRRPTSVFHIATSTIRPLDELADSGLRVNDKVGNAILDDMNTKSDPKFTSSDNVEQFLAFSKFQRERILVALQKRASTGDVDASNEHRKLNDAHNAKRNEMQDAISQLNTLKSTLASTPNNIKTLDSIISVFKREEEGKSVSQEIEYLGDVLVLEPSNNAIIKFLRTIQMSPSIDHLKLNLGILRRGADDAEYAHGIAELPLIDDSHLADGLLADGGGGVDALDDTLNDTVDMPLGNVTLKTVNAQQALTESAVSALQTTPGPKGNSKQWHEKAVRVVKNCALYVKMNSRLSPKSSLMPSNFATALDFIKHNVSQVKVAELFIASFPGTRHTDFVNIKIKSPK